MPASPYASVWYAWTAAWTGSLVVTWTVTTADSAFDTVVSVYTVGPNAILASLNPVASNDDCPGGGGTSCLWCVGVYDVSVYAHHVNGSGSCILAVK